MSTPPPTSARGLRRVLHVTAIVAGFAVILTVNDLSAAAQIAAIAATIGVLVVLHHLVERKDRL